MGVLKIKTEAGWVSIPSIGPQGPPGEIYRRSGDLTPELWHISHHIVNVAFLQGNPPEIGPGDFKDNRLYVVPFIIDKNRTIEQMSVWSYNWNKHYSYYVRFGIYNDTGNMYPGNLFGDFGETNLQFELSSPNILAGICPVDVNVSLASGLYWLLCVVDKLDSSTEDSGFVAGFDSGSVFVGINPLGIPLSNLNKRVIENNFSFTCYWRSFNYYYHSPSGGEWYDGDGLPSSGLGVDGDYYIDNLNRFVYRKENGFWVYKGYRRSGSEKILKALVDPFADGLTFKSLDLLPKEDNCPVIFVKFSS